MKYIYGPVKSRRLGFSLGLSLTPHKACSFNCIYCQLGKTTLCTCERKEYIRIAEILEELKLWLDNNASEALGLQYVTLSGPGEPTLNNRISELITQIKKVEMRLNSKRLMRLIRLLVTLKSDNNIINLGQVINKQQGGLEDFLVLEEDLRDFLLMIFLGEVDLRMYFLMYSELGEPEAAPGGRLVDEILK